MLFWITHVCADFRGLVKSRQLYVIADTEAGITSLDAGLRIGVAFQHWVCGAQSKIILHPQAGGDSKPVHQTHIPKGYDPFADIDYVNLDVRTMVSPTL